MIATITTKYQFAGPLAHGVFRSRIKLVCVVVINRSSLIVALPRARTSQTCSFYLPFIPRRSVPGHQEAILSALRRLQDASELTFFGSRGLQERSKRPPRGFLRASASKMRFGPNFGPIFIPKRDPWTSKIEEIRCTVDDFYGFLIFSLIRFWN